MTERTLFSPGGATEATLTAVLAELQQKLESGQQVALDAATLVALETINANVSGTVGVSNFPAVVSTGPKRTRVTGTLTNVNDTVVIDMTSLNTVTVSALGTFTGATVLIEHSPDSGTTWLAVQGFNNASQASVTQTMITASATPTTFTVPGIVAGQIRVRLTAITTGSVSVVMDGSAGTPSTPVGSLALVAGSSRIGFLSASGIWQDDSVAALGASATFTGSARDLTVAATNATFASSATYARELRMSATADVAGTLYLEVSRDSTTWRRVKSVALAAAAGTGTSFYGEIIHLPSTRYARMVFINGAGAQTYFMAQTIMMAQ